MLNISCVEQRRTVVVLCETKNYTLQLTLKTQTPEESKLVRNRSRYIKLKLVRAINYLMSST